MEAKQHSLFSLIACVIYLLCGFIKYLFFSLCFISRGGLLFEPEGDVVEEDLDGIDFDNLEVLADVGKV